MKTFSRLSSLTLMFLSVVFLLTGSVFYAHAQNAALEVEGAGNHKIGDNVTVTFYATIDGAPKDGVLLLINGAGLLNVTINGTPVLTFPQNADTGVTPGLGDVVVTGDISSAGAFVSAEWDRPTGDDDLFARAELIGDPKDPIIKVLAPEPCGHADTFNPKVGVKVGDVFKQWIIIQDVTDLSAWQMNVVFNPHILEVVSVEEGDFLEGGSTLHDETDDVDALFLASSGAGWVPVVDEHVGDYAERANSRGPFSTAVGEGKVAASQARIERGAEDQDHSDARRVGAGGLTGVTGTGKLMSICFRVLEFAEEPLGLHNVQLSDSQGNRISYSIQVNDFIVVTHKFPAADVNRDGYVNIQDLVLVASNIGLVPGNLHNPKADANADGVYGEGDGVRSGMYTEFDAPNNPIVPNLASVGDSHSRVDVNDDGIVNILDLIEVAMSADWGGASTLTKVRNANAASLSAPSMVAENLTPATIQAWIDLAQVEHDGSAIFEVGIANLEGLLVSRIPSETKLLLNYPNPFNPETWIPYQLAEATQVTVMIHTMNGSLVRTLELGHQAAGTYKSKSQAAYWDGRNEFGEQVASGLYFYTLTAGDFSATHKMLVRK